jgi:hypothetical protein
MTNKIYVPAWNLVLPINKKTGKVESYIDISPRSVDASEASNYDFYFNTYEESIEYCNKEEIRKELDFFLKWKEQVKKLGDDYKAFNGHEPNLSYLYPRLPKC